MKILFLTKWYPNKFDPQLGVFVQKHAEAASLFCDVAVLYVTQDSSLKIPFTFNHDKKDNLNEFILYFKPFKSGIAAFDRLVNVLFYFLFIHAAKKMINKSWGKQDITHAYILTRTALAAYLFKLRYNIPYVINEQWSGFANSTFQNQRSWKKKTVHFLTSKAKALITVSSFLKNKMMESGIQGNYFVVPNTINPHLAKNSETSTSSLIRIMVVADLVDEIKNVSGVIRSFHQISSKYTNANLQIIGDGKDRAMLEKLANETGLLNSKIFFLGRMTNEKVYEHLSQSSFLIVNSHVETFSSICIEAMCCGKPVLATRCGGPEDIVTNETGILIEPGNEGMLTGAMEEMINRYSNFDADLLKKYAAENFGAEKIGKMYFEIYKTVLSDIAK